MIVDVFIGVKMLMIVFMFVVVMGHMFMGVLVETAVFMLIRAQLFRFFHAVDFYRDMRPPDPAFGGDRIGKHDARNPERIQLSDKAFLVGEEIQQSCCQHIARSAHSAIQIKSFHSFSSL